MKVERIYSSELLNITKGDLWVWEASEKAGKNWSKAQVEKLVILDRRDILLWTGKKARIGVNIGLSVFTKWMAFPNEMEYHNRSCWSPFPARNYKFIVILVCLLTMLLSTSLKKSILGQCYSKCGPQIVNIGSEMRQRVCHRKVWVSWDRPVPEVLANNSVKEQSPTLRKLLQINTSWPG